MARKRRMVAATCAACGSTFSVRADRRGQRTCSITCAGALRSGAANARFNGGLCRHPTSGRWLIVCRDGSLMYFYRGVMAAQIGRLLHEDEIVHHINGNPGDDRPENLALTTRAAHIEMHRPNLMAGRT